MQRASARPLSVLPFARQARPLASVEAFGSLYARTHVMIYRYIYGLHGGPEQDVEDLTAETFIRAWKARRSFEGDEQAALRWLLQIARHLVIDSQRRRQRQGIPDSMDESSIPAADDSPEEQTLASEQRHLLGVMLAVLPDRQREILVLRYVLGWPVKDIAGHLEMPPNTVSVTIRRALKRLREDWPAAAGPPAE